MPVKKPGGAGSNSSMPPAATSKALLEKCQKFWRDMQKGKTLEANYAAIKSVAEAQPSGPLLVHLARASLYMALHEMESEFGVDSAFEKINPLVFPRGASSLKDRPHLDAAVVACQQGALQHRSLACAVFYAKLARGHGQLEALPHLRRMADSREFGWASWRDPLEDDPDNEAFKGKKNKKDRVLAGMVQLGKVVKDMDGSARSFGRWAEERARAVLQELLDPAEGQLAAPLLSKALLQKAIQKFNNAPKQLKVLTGEEIEAELQEQARMREGERHRGPRSQSDKSRQDQQERNEAARLQVVVKKAEQKLKEHAKTWAELGTKVSAFLPAKLAEAGPEGSPAQMEALLALCPVSKEELLNAMRSHLALQAAKMRGTPDEGVYACLEKRLLPIILQTKGWESWVYTDASGCAQYFSSGDALLKHWAAVVDWGSDDFGVTSTELWQAYFDGIGVWHHPLPPALPSTTSGAPSAVLTAEESRAAGETLLLEPFLTGLEARALLLQARKHEGPTKYMPLGVPPGVRSHAADILTRWLGPLQHNSEREEMQLGDPFLQHWRQLDRARRQIMTQLARRLEEQAGRTVPEVMTVHFDNEEKSAALASHDASHGELILWLARELAAGNALIVNQLLIAIENATQLRQPDLMFADALESVDDVAAADAIDTPPVDSVTVVDLLRRQRFASCEAGTQVILKWHGGPDPTTEEMTLLQEQASQLSAMSRKGELDAVASALSALQASAAADYAAPAAAPDAEGAADEFHDPDAPARDASAPGLSRRSSGESSVAKAAEQDLDTFADCEDHLPADADAPRTPDRKTTPRTALSTPGEALSRASSSGDHPGEVHGSSSVLGLPMQSVSKPGISPCTDSSPLLKEVLLGDIQLALRFLQDSRMLTECFMRSVGLFMRQHLPAADSADVHLGSLWKLPTERLHEVHQAVAAELAIHGQQLKVVQDAFTFIAGKMKLFEQPGTIRIHEDESFCYNAAAILALSQPAAPPCTDPTCTAHHHAAMAADSTPAQPSSRRKHKKSARELAKQAVGEVATDGSTSEAAVCAGGAVGASEGPPPDAAALTQEEAAESSVQMPESALTAARLQHLLKHMLSLEEAVVPPEGEPPAEAAARQQLHKAGELLRQVVHCRPQAKQFQGAVQEACELFSALLSEEEVLRGEAGGGQALRDWVSLAKRAWEVRTGVYKVYHTAVKQEAERGIQRAEHEGQQESRELVRKLKELEQQLKHLQRIGKGSSDEARHIFVQSQQVKMGIVHLTSMLERETDSQQRKVQAVRDIEADEFILTEDEKKARDTISEAYMWLFSGMEDRQAMEDMGLVSSVRRALHLVLGTTNRMLQKVWGLHVDLTRQMGIYYTLATEIMRMAVNASAVNALDEFLPYYNYALVEKLAKMADVYLEKRQAALADAFLEEVSTSEAASKTGAKGANAAQKKAGKSKAKKKGRAPQVQDKWRDDDEDAVEGQAASESGEPTASEAAASAGANGHAEPHEGGSTSAQPLTDEQLRAKLMNGSLSHLDFQPDFSDLALGEHADLDAYLASLTPNQLKKWKKKKSQRQQELLLEFKQAHAHLVPPASLPDQEGNQEGDQASGDAFVASASTPQPDVSADDGSDWQSVQKLRTRGGSRAARPEAAMQDEDKEGGWEQPRSGRAAKGPSAGPRPDAGLSYREQIGPIFQGQCSYCSQFGHRERSCAKRRTDRDAGKPEAFAVPHHDGECNYCKKWGHTERYCPSHPDVLPCRYCRKLGHLHRECPDQTCATCGRGGHHATRCSQQLPADACSRCGQRGHPASRCPEVGCYNCGIKGHESRNCPHPRNHCQLCDKPTHQAVHCHLWRDSEAAEPDRANGERPFSATLPHDKAQAQARPATDDASPWQTVNQPAQPAADHAQSQANGVPGSAAASRPRPSQRPSPAGVAVQHEAGSAEAGSGPDDAQSAEQRLMQQQQQQLEYYAQQRLKAQQAQQAGWQTPGETRAHSTAAAQDSWAGSGPGTPTSYATGYPASQAPPHIPQSPQRYAPQSYHPSPPAPPPVWGAPSTNGPNPPAYGQASPSRESAARQYASPYSPQPLQPAAAGEAATDFDDLLGNLLGGPQAATPALHPPAQPEGWEDHDYPALGAPPAASWASRVVTKEAADGDQEALMEDDEALQQAIQASLAESSRTRPVPVDSPTAPQPQSQALVPGVATPGLQNATGEYNCFLNVIIQCLWHCSDFRDRLMQWDPQLAQGNDVVAALVDLFHAFAEEAAERREPANLKEHQVVAPTALREALSALPSQNFRMGEMNDASEVLLALYGSLELVKDAAGRALGLDLVNRSFGLEVSESVHCPDCSLETHKTSYTQYFYNVSATALRLVKTFSVDETFGMILRQIEGNHQKTCDTDRGGCGNKLSVRHFLNSVPLIFTLQLAWESQQEEGQDILDTLNGVEEEVDISAVYLGLTEPHIFKLRSMVCYYGAHYHAFVFSAEAGKWLMFDDATINAVGSWRDVVSKCFAGRIQPSVLFYTSSSQETK